jgi:hypothetical protein
MPHFDGGGDRPSAHFGRNEGFRRGFGAGRFFGICTPGGKLPFVEGGRRFSAARRRLFSFSIVGCGFFTHAGLLL